MSKSYQIALLFSIFPKMQIVNFKLHPRKKQETVSDFLPCAAVIDHFPCAGSGTLTDPFPQNEHRSHPSISDKLCLSARPDLTDTDET